MIPVNKEDIVSVYNYFKAKAISKYNQSQFEESLSNIELCAKIAYYSNFFYNDLELEDYLRKISLKILAEPICGIANGRYVIIDTNGSDNQGLIFQYIRAFIEMNVEFAYIHESLDLSRIRLILSELENYSKATVFTFDQAYSLVDQIKRIAHFIQEYKPEKYFMYIMPWDTVATSICSALVNTVKYNINLTDHAFWLGSAFIDYSIEFRDYGATVSMEKRGLLRHQLIKVPFYPLHNKSTFKDLPLSQESDIVKIFSGGTFYKIYGENNKFFYLIKRLLEENENVELFFAGGGNDKPFRKFLKKNSLENRVHLIGHRSDIIEVFENIDIYLGTYPISGGLMSQYAAICGKPILAYTDPKYLTNIVEGLVSHNKFNLITHTSEDSFFEYANQLCASVEFRLSEGKKLIGSVITSAEFADELSVAINSNKSKREIKLEKIDYVSFSNLYLDVENKFEFIIQKHVILKLGVDIISFPKLFINAIVLYFRKFFIKNI